jgi:hypothetical protein
MGCGSEDELVAKCEEFAEDGHRQIQIISAINHRHHRYQLTVKKVARVLRTGTRLRKYVLRSLLTTKQPQKQRLVGFVVR